MAGTESLGGTDLMRDLSAIAKDAEAAVAYSLLDTVAAFGRAGLLQPAHGGGGDGERTADDPGPLLKFVVEQAMLTEADLVKAERGELVKLVA